MKIAICSPIHSGAKPRFVQSLSRMVTHTLTAATKPIEIETLIVSTSNVAFSRREITKAALSWGADWLLWLDADHIFPSDTLLRLLAQDKAIIGANYRRRTERNEVTAYTDGGRKPLGAKKDGVEEVDQMGLGVCLIKAGVFRAMSQPYFYDEMLPDGSSVGEDVTFFRNARKAGFPAYVDHGLSREVAHTADIHLWLQSPAAPTPGL